MKNLRLEIDPLKLDEEWQEHPSVYGYWAEQAAEAQAVYDGQKAEVDLVKADIDRLIRDDPKSYDIEKITETAISNAILVQPEYRQALKKLNRVKRELGLAQAALNALEHRKRALSLLVELWIRDYYSDQRKKQHTEPLDEDGKRAVRSRGINRDRDTNGD